VRKQLNRHTAGLVLAGAGVDAWGVARNDPQFPLAPPLPSAISIMMRLSGAVLQEIATGPTAAYLAECRRVDQALQEAAAALERAITDTDHQTISIPAATDGEAKHPFSHKEVAARAGLGWIGKTALFVSREFGPAVRLATVFTDLPLPPGKPIRSGRCGTCVACLRACPAGAGRNITWQADATQTDQYGVDACGRHAVSAHTPKDHVCAICIGVCPLSQGGRIVAVASQETRRQRSG